MKLTDNIVKVLGDDNKVYEVADFAALGKTCDDAIGIVFGTPMLGSRVLAFPSWKERWGEEGELLTTEHIETSAVQIESGLDDSKRIYEIQKEYDSPTAVTRCMEYKCGNLQWYLPSLMEVGALHLLRTEINNAMKTLRCNKDCFLPTEGCVWSSSEYTSNRAWYVYFTNGSFGNSNKSVGTVVRAVAAFSSSPRLLTDGAKSQDDLTDSQLIQMLKERGYKGKIEKIVTNTFEL